MSLSLTRKESEARTETYPGFTGGLHHLIEGTTKEFYRKFRVKKKIIRGRLWGDVRTRYSVLCKTILLITVLFRL